MPALSANAECEVYDLAEVAAEALEDYRRAPWRRLSDRVRLERLRRAIALLQRVERQEALRMPAGPWVA